MKKAWFVIGMSAMAVGAHATIRYIALYLERKYGILPEHSGIAIIGLVFGIFLLHIYFEQRNEPNRTLDSPDIMAIPYTPLTRVVHSREDDPESRVQKDYRHMKKQELSEKFQAVKKVFATGDVSLFPKDVDIFVLYDQHAADVYNEYEDFEELLRQVKRFASNNNKLEAVKLIKRTGLFGGLKESKDFVDFQMDELQD